MVSTYPLLGKLEDTKDLHSTVIPVTGKAGSLGTCTSWRHSTLPMEDIRAL